MPSLDDIHDAILMAILEPGAVHLTPTEDIALKTRLLDIIQNGGNDPVVVAKLFERALAGDDYDTSLPP